jgi:cephalosporin hydroxylase
MADSRKNDLLLPTLRALKKVMVSAPYQATVQRAVNSLFFNQLVVKTKNFGRITWLGKPIWQNVFDLWTIQETIFEVKPSLLIESGTNRGGSAYFYAQLFDLMGHGQVITVDIRRLHELSHPRIQFVIGSSLDESVLDTIREAIARNPGPVMVILDSDHRAEFVRQEMERFAPFVTPSSFMLVQDGVVDVLPIFRRGRPGPLAAIKQFLRTHSEFEVDQARSERFLITHHPSGWLKRIR